MDDEHEPIERGVGSRVKKRILDGFIGNVRKKVDDQRETVRELQVATGRTEERVIGLRVYEKTVQGRDVIPQARFDYNIAIRDGEAVFLDEATEPSVTVRTDLSTVIALLQNELTVEHKGRPKKIVRPFKPMDALRMGLLETDGRATSLRDLMLLERTILPKLGPKLGLTA